MPRIALPPEQILELHLERKKPNPPTMETLASRYGVSVRSLHRYLQGEVVEVDVAGEWVAPFLYSPDSPPQRLGDWQKSDVDQ
jgi:hypothetical protein